MINNNKKASNPSNSQQQQCFWHQNLKSGCAFYLEKSAPIQVEYLYFSARVLPPTTTTIQKKLFF